MKKNIKNGVVFFQFQELAESSPFGHAFFSRQGGVSPLPFDSLNLGPLSGDAPANLRENLNRIASALAAPSENIVAARQVHGCKVVRVSARNRPGSVFSEGNPSHADGLTTDQGGIWLGILTADCLPILFFDPRHRAIGAAHAGWRGTLMKVVASTVLEMQSAFGSRPEDLWAAIGPAIGPCCYRVGQEVADAFVREDMAYEPFLLRKKGDCFTLDLQGINRKQMLDLAMNNKRILTTSLCTRCRNDLFFSVRGQPDPTGRQISLVGIR